MADPLDELTKIEGLAPRDAILARALIRSQFVDAVVVLEAARTVAGSPPSGGILEHLTTAGHLDAARAKQMEEALEKRIAEKRAAEGATGEADGSRGVRTPIPGKGPKMWQPPKKSKRRTGETSVFLLGALREERKQKEREAVQLFVERFVRSRLHQLVLFQLLRQKEGIAEPRALADRTGATQRDVARILWDWKAKGILRTLGAFPYYYQPPPEVRGTIDQFTKAWKDPKQHAELLKRILELEST